MILLACLETKMHHKACEKSFVHEMHNHAKHAWLHPHSWVSFNLYLLTTFNLHRLCEIYWGVQWTKPDLYNESIYDKLSLCTAKGTFSYVRL